MGILLDSTILIDHFNGIEKARKFILDNKSKLFLSFITRAEVLTGFDNEAALIAKKVLDFFPLLPVTPQDADLAAELRRLEKWKLPDAFQAAFAKNNKLTLATRNTKDFQTNKHNFVTIPYHL